MDEKTVEMLVRDFFSLRRKNDELQVRLQEYATPPDRADEKFMKGVLCYLKATFLPMSHEIGLRDLYANLRIFAHDYPDPLAAYKYSPVWTRHGTSPFDVSRIIWGVNRAIGYKTPVVGEFLKVSFPDLYRRSSVRTLASNLIRYDDNMTVRNIDFGTKLPREWFEELYEREHVKD